MWDRAFNWTTTTHTKIITKMYLLAQFTAHMFRMSAWIKYSRFMCVFFVSLPFFSYTFYTSVSVPFLIYWSQSLLRRYFNNRLPICCSDFVSSELFCSVYCVKSSIYHFAARMAGQENVGERKREIKSEIQKEKQGIDQFKKKANQMEWTTTEISKLL